MEGQEALMAVAPEHFVAYYVVENCVALMMAEEVVTWQHYY